MSSEGLASSEIDPPLENATQHSVGTSSCSIYKDGRFHNPWDTWEELSFKRLMKWVLFDKSNSNIPSSAEQLEKTLPVIKIDPKEIEEPPSSGIRLAWLGHASTLVQFDGITILTDPIFSNVCGPMNKFGKRRYRPCPIAVQDLPDINAVVISHNHYDHLDEASVRELNKKFGESLNWFVPLKLRNWFQNNGCVNVTELDWWQESILPRFPNIKFIFTPTQHWSKRTAFDTCKTLWGSWAIKGPTQSYYFAGDTGYCSVFREIGERCGPFTLAAIPIGAYEPRWFKKAQHIDPQQAVKVHMEVKAKRSFGIHWGTFPLGSEFYLSPPEEVSEALKENNLGEDEFFTPHHGQVVTLFQE